MLTRLCDVIHPQCYVHRSRCLLIFSRHKELFWYFSCFWNFFWLLCQSSWIFWNQEKNIFSNFCLDLPMKLSMISKAPFSSSFSFWKVEIVVKTSCKRLIIYWCQRPRRTWNIQSQCFEYSCHPACLFPIHSWRLSLARFTVKPAIKIKKIETSIRSYNINFGKRNLTGSSGRINRVKFKQQTAESVERRPDPNGRYDQNEIKRNKGLYYFKQNCLIYCGLQYKPSSGAE